MNYIEAREFIDRITMEKGSVPGLEAVRALLFKMGNPQNKLKAIHVAGTNGKGSVIAYIFNILKCAGYRVGTYNSPSVFEYLERIRVDGINISEQEYAEGISHIQSIYSEMKEAGESLPTAFEMETALAFDYFVRSKCDIVIIETGMGGRLDATNVCDEVLASVIMSVSMDHMEFLGDTVEKIAYEKAGIIKNGCPVIVYNQSENVMGVVRKRAEELQAQLTVSGEPQNICYDADTTRFDYMSRVSGHAYDNLLISLKGSIQVRNACVALEVIEVVKKMQYNIDSVHIKKGLVSTKWPGRFEKICDNPLIYIDGAHNPDAVKTLNDTVDMYYKEYTKIYIMGVFKDKDFEKELEYIVEGASHIFTVTPDNKRALAAEELASVINSIRNIASPEKTVEQAVGLAVTMAESIMDKKSVIIAFGSLSYLGEVTECVKTLTE